MSNYLPGLHIFNLNEQMVLKITNPDFEFELYIQWPSCKIAVTSKKSKCLFSFLNIRFHQHNNSKYSFKNNSNKFDTLHFW